jgi:HEAT repeat protein
MREGGMIERRIGVLTLVGLSIAAAAAAQSAADPVIQELSNPSTRARIQALRTLGEAARADAAVPMAALLLDGNDNVQFEAVNAILQIYTVRADLTKRPWGAGAIGRPATMTAAEAAFEAGPLATIPAAVPAEVLSNLSSVMRQDESARIRLNAAYALGVLGSPAMGPMTAAAVEPVTANVISGLTHKDADTRQVIARVAGRVFPAPPGGAAPVAVGDALVAAMNDSDSLTRRWAMDSLGWLKYDRAVQALTDHASYYGKGEEGVAALHALARIANPASGPVFRALLANAYVPFRVVAIEGLGRIGDKGASAQIADSAASAGDVSVTLAASYAKFLLGEADLIGVTDALERPDTTVQANVYLGEVALTRPQAIHPLLKTPNPSTRMVAVEVLGASQQPSEKDVLEPLLKDPAPEVVNVTSEALRRLNAYAAQTTK